MTKTRQAAETREDPRGTATRILDAAEAVFAEHGYGAASTREMTRRAGVPFGALHYHWGSKKQLWEAVFKRLGERTRETIMQTIRPGNTRRELADNLVDAFLDLLVAHPNTVRLAYWMSLERPELHLRSVRQMFGEIGRFGSGFIRDTMPDVNSDVPAALFVISNAFIASLADVDGQEEMLGGSVYASRPARDRLRAQLKRFSYLVFNVSP
jgi:AcrR family transcriptional regulator